MKGIGWYSDGTRRFKAFPADKLLTEAKRCVDSDIVASVANYLESGQVVIATPGIAYDPLGSGNQVSLDVLTDGNHVWPGEAAFLCRHYGVLPSEDIAAIALEADGKCPTVPPARLQEIADAIRGQVEPTGTQPSESQ